mmetsp:Transcript_36701/g.56947  ORF Transcript_36701/g.56947 Transcript_36701/m.56947 type:complete len:289 (+) Transcript_36701:29-895(+)
MCLNFLQLHEGVFDTELARLEVEEVVGLNIRDIREVDVGQVHDVLDKRDVGVTELVAGLLAVALHAIELGAEATDVVGGGAGAQREDHVDGLGEDGLWVQHGVLLDGVVARVDHHVHGRSRRELGLGDVVDNLGRVLRRHLAADDALGGLAQQRGGTVDGELDLALALDDLVTVLLPHLDGVVGVVRSAPPLCPPVVCAFDELRRVARVLSQAVCGAVPPPLPRDTPESGVEAAALGQSVHLVGLLVIRSQFVPEIELAKGDVVRSGEVHASLPEQGSNRLGRGGKAT